MKGQRVRPSSEASRKAAASSTLSDGSQPPFGTERTVSMGGVEKVVGRPLHLQTQWSGRLRLVTTRTFPAVLSIGIAQQTTRGVARPLVPIGSAV
jgi:hypothetical protein